MHIGIFLDRDGTVNEETDFLTSPDELRLIDGSADAIRLANDLGLKVFIITNQSAVARGLLTEDRLAEIHSHLIALLKSNHAHIDAIYYCPHHPEFGEPPYRTDCVCRKPNTGMLMQAAREFDIDLKRSFVIGDRIIDIQTGNNIGAPSILVLTGYGKEEAKHLHENSVRIDHVAENLYGAIQYIKHVIHQEQPSSP